MAFATFTGVNDTALGVAVSDHILESMVQTSLFLDGVGVTQLNITDVHAGGVRVPKLVVASGQTRQLGSAHNAGWFDENAVVAKGLDEKFVPLLYIYNTPEDVPTSQQALSVGGASNVLNRAKMIGKAITKQMNGGTLATMIVANLNAVITASGTETGYIYTYTPATTGDAYKYFVTACAGLDDGDDYNDYFPIEGRLALVRTEWETSFKTVASNLYIGGSNFAQDMQSRGILSPDANPPTNINGYRGIVNSVPVFVATKAVWDEAEDWICVASTNTAVSPTYLDNITAVICSNIATYRGFAIAENTKVVDSQSGQGVRIQPEVVWGVETVYAKGVKMLAKATFVEGSAALEVIPPGSQA